MELDLEANGSGVFRDDEDGVCPMLTKMGAYTSV